MATLPLYCEYWLQLKYTHLNTKPGSLSVDIDSQPDSSSRIRELYFAKKSDSEAALILRSSVRSREANIVRPPGRRKREPCSSLLVFFTGSFAGGGAKSSPMRFESGTIPHSARASFPLIISEDVVIMLCCRYMC